MQQTMTDTITILGLAGSRRHGSFNADLLRAAAAAASAGCMVDIASLRGIPLYNSDVEEATGVMERVAAAFVQRRSSPRRASTHTRCLTCTQSPRGRMALCQWRQ